MALSAITKPVDDEPQVQQVPVQEPAPPPQISDPYQGGTTPGVGLDVPPGGGAPQVGLPAGTQSPFDPSLGIEPLERRSGTMKQYEKDVLSGYYLDLANNPYAQQYAGAITQNYDENLARDLSLVQGAFAGSPTLGMGGAAMSAKGRVVDDSREKLSNSLAQMYSGLYESESALMNEIDAIKSGRKEVQIMANAQKYGYELSAAATRYAADQSRIGAITAANAYADASRYGANLAAALGRDRLAFDITIAGQKAEAEARALEADLAEAGQPTIEVGGTTNKPTDQPDPLVTGFRGGGGASDRASGLG